MPTAKNAKAAKQPDAPKPAGKPGPSPAEGAPNAIPEEVQSLQRSFTPDSVNEFIQKMSGGGRAAMATDHENIRQNERHVLHFMQNTMKNRFSNVLLFNEGAVFLNVTKHDKPEETYIHATKIKSSFGNYVLAQSPKPETVFDWFRMIWQLNIRVVVSLIPMDSHEECAKYFERKVGKKFKVKRFSLKTFAVRNEVIATTYEIHMKNSDDKHEERVMYVVRFPHWKEVVRPPSAKQFVELTKSVWALERISDTNRKADKTISYTLVHGVTGTRRTGAFVLTSMLCRQMRERSQLSVVTACSTVRKYRYGVMRNRVCYTVMLESILRYASDQGYINGKSSEVLHAIESVRNNIMIPELSDDEESW